MSREKIYFIMESEDYDEQKFGFAFSPSDIDPREIQQWSNYDDWKTLVLEIRNGRFADYLTNDLNIPLCSFELLKVINRSLNDDEAITWYPVQVFNGSKARIYHYMQLNKVLNEVIDLDNSERDEYVIYKPYFIEEKTESIFRCDFDESYLFVKESLKEDIEKRNFTGLDFATW